MSSSTWLGGEVGQGAAGPAEVVVECDRCGHREEPAGDAGSERVEGAGAVAFEGEDVFGGPEDAFDALADRREVRSGAGFGFAVRAQDQGADFANAGFEGAAGVALVTDQGLSASPAAGEHPQRDLTLIDLGRGQLQSARGAVRGEDRVQPEAVEEAAVAGAKALVRDRRERVGQAVAATALDRLATASTLDRGRVNQQHRVVVAGTHPGELVNQRLDRVAESLAALVEPRAPGQRGEQMAQLLGGDPGEAMI